MAFVALLVAAFLGMSQAHVQVFHFQCNRKISNYNNTNTILDLGKLLTLESVCLDYCQQANCSGGPDCKSDTLNDLIGTIGGVAADLLSGPVKCLLDPNGDGSNPNKCTPSQACMFPCILDINLLDTCNVQAIVTTLLKSCPKGDKKGLCVSACACCDDGNLIDACVNLCLSNQGIDLILDPLSIPVLGIGKGDKGGLPLPGLPSLPIGGLPKLPLLGGGLPNLPIGL